MEYIILEKIQNLTDLVNSLGAGLALLALISGIYLVISIPYIVKELKKNIKKYNSERKRKS